VIHHETSPVVRNEAVFAENPLGKVPVLLRPGHVALATAMSWLAFRGLPDFRGRRPRLTAWFDAFADRPSMRATPLSGETVDTETKETG
jgi:glutathione S-transferase